MYSKQVFAETKSAFERESDALQVALHHVEQLTINKHDSMKNNKLELSQLESELSNKDDHYQQLLQEIANLEKLLSNEDALFLPNYDAQFQYYKQFVQLPITDEAKQIKQVIHSHSFKGIIVYPNAVHWEPLQRPQHLLMEFSRKGYLCFFCDPKDEFYLREAEKGLFIVSKQEHLLQALQAHHVLVLNSFLMQNAWVENLPHKSIWYDVLDRVDFFSLYDRNMLAKHYQVLHEADIVTYSAKKLHEYVEDREDTIYLPNAVRPEDFTYSHNKLSKKPDDLIDIVKKNKKVIGYYGAIEEWFDTELVQGLAEDKNIEIVLIGHCGISKATFPQNVHFLGAKPYYELKEYAAYFDALIIPFKVTTLTNAVSPVKFFEYCAIGKPIITTPIAEVLPFKGPGITFVKPGEKINLGQSFWNLTATGKAHLTKIAKTNQWSKRAEQVYKELEKRPSALKVFANRQYDKSLSVFTATFFDYDGGNYYTGGAERYLVDLHEVCQEMGLRLDLYQYGNYSWYRKYKDIDVYSLGHETLDMSEFSVPNLNAFNNRYLQAVEGHTMMNFYSAFFQAFPNIAHPSIGISHGVAWDNRGSKYKNGDSFWLHNERFIKSAEQVQKMVSVDTNTANWFQTISFKIGQNMQTIPNYVDTNIFHPVPKKKDGKVRIVYPRRLYEARGLYITLNIVDGILEKYPNTEFHFVGKGFDEDVENINKAISRWPNRIFCYHREPDDMHLVYKEADIVLIPTLYSEGTSLSCLEACATANTVIATRIGGLTDIIIDRYNGLLINPTSKALEEAISECLDRPDFSKKLGENALAVSKAFNKDIWKERWKEVIRLMLQETSEYESNTYDSNEAIQENVVEIRLNPDTKQEDWMPIAIKYLQSSKYVFIRGHKSMLPEMSFGRIQWISEETKLYFQSKILSLN